MAELTPGIALEIEKSVRRGGPFLDEHYDRWRDRVVPSTIKMDDPMLCVLAQASGKGYYQTAGDHNLDYGARARLGFLIPVSTPMEEIPAALEYLDREWLIQYFS